MISFDLVRMTKEVQEGLQREAAKRLKDFDSSKLFCGATHTHCGPSISYERTGPGQLYDLSNETDVMTPQQYILLLYERVGAGIVEAWQSRTPAGMSWGLGNAAVGYNRRLSYTDGSAIMGFDTARPDFSHIEGSEDQAVEMLFFWDSGQKLTGMLLNIACPSQVGRKAISADFWHPIREGHQGEIRTATSHLRSVRGGGRSVSRTDRPQQGRKGDDRAPEDLVETGVGQPGGPCGR